MFCNKCGKEIYEGSEFCPYCGNQIAKNDGVTSATLDRVTETEMDQSSLPAKQGKRLSNYFIDLVGFVVASFMLGLALGFIGFGSVLQNIDSKVLGYILMFFYYFISESIWAKTPAKFLTKTHVIRTGGSRPEFTNIFIRTLCRFIPFEPLTFVFSKRPVGWHDKLSKTLVVEDN